MKKTIISIISITIMSAMLGSCSLPNVKTDASDSSEVTLLESTVSTPVYSESETTTIVEVTENSENADLEPREEQIQYACQLATIECYYHNVARAIKTAGTGITHLGEEDTEFWFEYSAQATLGIEASSVYMEFNGNHITVYMPHASIIGNINVDAESVSDPVCPPHRALQNDVDITASDVTAAMEDANDDIAEEIVNDPYLLGSAERRAQDLIQSYINQIMIYSNTSYEVSFVFVEET